MLHVSRQIHIPEEQIEIHAIRASGPGGQNVNKVSSAVHLRFDIAASSLPDYLKQRLLQLRDRRIGRDGVIIIKAQRQRTREQNRADALQRLLALLQLANTPTRKRVPTRPTRASRRKRLENKAHRGRLKQLRAKVSD